MGDLGRGALRLGAALLAALGLTIVVILLARGHPVPALRSLLDGAFGSRRDWGNSLTTMTPLLLTGLGVSLAFRARLWNIGGEGQFLVGALAASALGAYALKGLPAFLLLPLVLLGGAAGGALWGGLAGWMRVRRGVPEVISTIMLNFVAAQLLSYLVHGPLQEADHALPATEALPPGAILPTLVPQTSLSVGFALVLLLAGLTAVFLARTPAGFALRAVGANPEAARAAGIDVARVQTTTMLWSGLLCGLAGALELSGNPSLVGTLYENYAPGYGFTAVAVALLGRLNPYGIVASSFFFGALSAGSGEMQRAAGVSSVLVDVVQGGALLILLAFQWVRWEWRPAADAALTNRPRPWYTNVFPGGVRRSPDPEVRRRLWLLLGSALLAFWQLGHVPLLDNDEPVYGQVGKEMAAGGLAGWLTPHNNGQVWFDKPPLFYWLVALAMRVLGPTEFAARLPSALLSVVLVGVTGWLARRCFPQVRSAGIWAGFVLATCLQHFLLARAAVTDMTLAVALTAALLAVWEWTRTNRGIWVALAGVMTGLAILTKGPVALVLIGLQIVGYLCLVRRARRLLSLSLWGGLGLCLLVALPWFLAMIHLHGRVFVQGFLEANNVTRYLKPEHRATQSPLFFVPVFLAGFFPWTLAVPGAAARAARQARLEWAGRAEEAPALFLGLWFCLVFVFFSGSQSKLVTYIFPLYPAAAALVGCWLAQRVAQPGRDPLLRVFAVLIPLLGVALAILGRSHGVPPVTLWLWVAVGAAAAIALLPVRRSWGWGIVGASVALLLLNAWISPFWQTRFWQRRHLDLSERGLAPIASALTPAGGTIYALGLTHPSLLFYANRRVLYGDDRIGAAALLARHPDWIIATRPHILSEMRARNQLRRYRVRYADPNIVLIQAAV